MHARYWRVHFALDPAMHWTNIDCGRPVSESDAVILARRAYPDRGVVTNAIQDVEQERVRA